MLRSALTLVVCTLSSSCCLDTGRGILYTSDATGIIFSESLKNHLYPNYEDLTDFYRVQSMRGVYIASQLMPDDSIRTMITFDRGGEWQPIKRPDGAPCKDESKVFYLIVHALQPTAVMHCALVLCQTKAVDCV